MNEFEWRRQLRELRQPLQPRPDLWSSIDAALNRIDHEPLALDEISVPPLRKTRSRWALGVAVAASVLLAGSVAWRAMRPPATVPIAAVEPSSSNWRPSDPRLAGAAIELDAAQMELKLALEQAPGSPALQRLLDRTESQQSQLRQIANQAG